MKRGVLFVLGAAALAFLAPVSKASGPAICDSQQSTLCANLTNVFAFEENSDNPRFDENRAVAFLEAGGQNVARATGKVDSYAASFTGTDGNYLHIPRGGSLINGSTVALWIYPTSAATEQIILSADETTKHGPYLSLVPSGGNVKVKGVAYYGDGRGDVSVTSTSTMTLNAWHLVVWGYDQAEASDFLTTSQTGRVMYVQVDAGARDKVGLAYFPIVGPYNDLVLGQRKGSGTAYTLPFSGRVDQLTFAGRTWDSVDAAEFYNAGSGKPYPFVPSSFDSLNAGLVAYWKFDEAVSSGTRYDSVNQNNAADTGGAMGYAAGKIANASYSDWAPNGESLDVAADSSVNYSGDFTVGGWVKTDSVIGAQGFAGKGSEWVIHFEGTGGGNRVFFSLGDASCTAYTAAGMIAAGTWYFVVADYTASTKTCRIRINNGTVYSDTGTDTPAASPWPLSFYHHNSGWPGYGTGHRDEWFLYKRVLTSQQMTDLYNGGAGRTYPF